MDRIAVAAQALLRRFTINGHNAFAVIGNMISQPIIQSCLKVFHVTAGQSATNGRRTRWCFTVKPRGVRSVSQLTVAQRTRTSISRMRASMPRSVKETMPAKGWRMPRALRGSSKRENTSNRLAVADILIPSKNELRETTIRKKILLVRKFPLCSSPVEPACSIVFQLSRTN